MKTITYFLAVIMIFLTSCNFNNTDQPKEDPNVKKVYREDGSLLASYTMKNGKYDGIAYDYYKNGGVRLQFNYVNGLREGIVKRFYEDGKLYSETPYIHDTIDGIKKIFFKSGKVSSEIPYCKGLAEPGLKEYDESGALRTKEITLLFTLSKTNKNKLEITTSKKAEIARYFSLTGTAPFYTKTEIPAKKGIAIISYNKNAKEPLLIEAQIKTDFGSLHIIRTSVDANTIKK